jgi:hypothetical protein
MKYTRNMLLAVVFSFSSQFMQQDQPSCHCWEPAGSDIVEWSAAIFRISGV